MAHMHRTTCIEALKRADYLIEQMASYVGKMVVPAEFFAALNDHFLHIEAVKRADHGTVDHA